MRLSGINTRHYFLTTLFSLVLVSSAITKLLYHPRVGYAIQVPEVLFVPLIGGIIFTHKMVWFRSVDLLDVGLLFETFVRKTDAFT